LKYIDNRKTYIEGETVVYLAYSLHEPSCEVDSEYYVVFNNVIGINIFYI
jgi:hypothetical protein